MNSAIVAELLNQCAARVLKKIYNVCERISI